MVAVEALACCCGEGAAAMAAVVAMLRLIDTEPNNKGKICKGGQNFGGNFLYGMAAAGKWRF